MNESVYRLALESADSIADYSTADVKIGVGVNIFNT